MTEFYNDNAIIKTRNNLITSHDAPLRQLLCVPVLCASVAATDFCSNLLINTCCCSQSDDTVLPEQKNTADVSGDVIWIQQYCHTVYFVYGLSFDFIDFTLFFKP